MKTIHVVAAIIEKEGRYFATQRGYGEFKDGWEFPGGKIEQGESPEEALQREIREELDTQIAWNVCLLRSTMTIPSFICICCVMCVGWWQANSVCSRQKMQSGLLEKN